MDKKNIAMNMLWNSIGSLFFLGCQWLITVLVVRFNSSYEDAGILSLGFSIFNTVYGIATLNLRTVQITEIDGKFQDGDFILNRFLFSAVAIILTVVVVFYNGYNQYTAICVLLIVCFRMVEAIVDVFHGIDQKAWRMDIIAKSFILRGALTLFSFILGLVVFDCFWISIVFMVIANYAALVFFDIKECRSQIQINYGWKAQSVIELTKIGIPTSIQCVLLNSIATIPRMSIENIYGENLLGIFASISMPAILVSQIASYFFNPLLNLFAKYQRQQNYRRGMGLIAVCILVILSITAVSMIAGYILGDWILSLIFGKSILEYTYLFPWVLLTAGMLAIIWFLNGVLTALKHYKQIVIITCIPTIIAFLLSNNFIYRRGLEGAVDLTIIAYGLDIVLSIVCLSFIIKRDFTKL